MPSKKGKARAAGWYDDAGRQRYWNGEEWTEHFADTYAADPPAPSVPDRLRALWVGWTSRERWVALGSAAGTVIGLLGLIVPLAVADRVASVDTVAVDSQLGDDGGLLPADAIEPIASGLSSSAGGLASDAGSYTTWAIPVDAPWAELFALHVCETDSAGRPTARGDADTAAAGAWIERYGIPTTGHELWAYVTNTAGSGSITVSEIRPQGTLTPAPDRVWVRKGVCGGVGDCGTAINAHLALGADPVAVFGDPPTYDGCDTGEVSDIVAQPGDPVVVSVAPGEARPFHVQWTQTEDFVGRIVATVTAGDQRSTIDLSPDNTDITALAVNEPATLLLAGYGEYTFGCDPDGNAEAPSPGNTVAYCNLDQWLAMIGKD